MKASEKAAVRRVLRLVETPPPEQTGGTGTFPASKSPLRKGPA